MLIDQFNALSLKDQAATIKALREAHKDNRVVQRLRQSAAKEQKVKERLEKQQALALKREQAIFRAQARLEKLLSKQVGKVGTKAKAAARRPSKAVVTYGAEANAIASAIMAKKASA